MYKVIKSYLTSVDIDKLLIAIMIFLMANFLARAILNMQGMSMTPWIKLIVQICIICFVIFLINNNSAVGLLKQLISFKTVQIELKAVIVIFLIALPVSLIILNTGFYLLLWLFIMYAVLLSLGIFYYMLVNKPVISLCLYFLLLPITAYIDYEMSRTFSTFNTNFEWFFINFSILALLIMFFLFFIAKQFSNDVIFPKNNILGWVFIYFIATFVSVVFSDNVAFSFRGYLLSVIYPVLVYFIVVNSVKTKEQIKIILIILTISVLIHTSLNFYYYIKYFKNYLNIPFLLSYSASDLSSVLLLVILISLGLFIVEKKRLLKFGYLFIFIFFVIAVLYTLSRAATILLFLSLLYLAFEKSSRKYLIPIIAAGLIIVVLNVNKITPLLFRYHSLRSVDSAFKEETSISNHIQGWRAGLGMFKDHPLVGVGIGRYPTHYHKYEKLVDNSNPLYTNERVPMDFAHEIVLNYLSETGLIGTIPVLILLFMILKIFISVFVNSSGDLLSKVLCLSFFLFFIRGFITGSALGDSRNLSMSSQILWSIIALTAVKYNLHAKFNKS